MTCHVLMAIDCSGSMHPNAPAVRDGVNEYLDTLGRDTETVYYVTVALFNTFVSYMCEAQPVAAVPPLDRDNYLCGGSTALFDAVGSLVSRLEPVGDNDRVLAVVHTDGQENASRLWTREAVAGLIADRKTDPRYGFVFLGAGVDNWQQGYALGFASTPTRGGATGTRNTYSSLAANTTEYAQGRKSAQEVAADTGAASMGSEGDL